MDRLVLILVGGVAVWSECAGAFFTGPAVGLVFRIPPAEIYPVFESAGFLAAIGGAVSLVSVFFRVWFSA